MNKKALSRSLKTASIHLQKLASTFSRADVAVFHELMPPPDGGGNQFIRALWHEMEKLGLKVENNTLSPVTRACLYNSFNFDFERLRIFRRKNCRMVHRVDGPVGVYRGWDDGSDRRIWQINQEMADATIFQSMYSLQRHLDLGLEFLNPTVILNAADPRLFHRQGKIPFDRGRKIRLISASWSDNPNKGAPTYKWLEEHLDWDRFEYTFVGRTQIPFERIRVVQPLPSAELADLLRQQDIYITASREDPCSNALIEAQNCGLPALYLRSGGHPEIARDAGLGFTEPKEMPDLLDELVENYERYQQAIALPSLSEVTRRYLEVLQVV